ncbi:MAG: c-type cytochrome [Saprospiraceae bacterium]|nr:c-type cytochrome [Saprospiraceae bacterium]
MQSFKRGYELFSHHCAICHGKNGTGTLALHQAWSILTGSWGQRSTHQGGPGWTERTDIDQW